jgi:hypothetical protein
MNPIAAPARFSAREFKPADITHRSFLTRAFGFLLRFRNADDGIAKRYEGSSWCDATEHDLNRDVMTGHYTVPLR